MEGGGFVCTVACSYRRSLATGVRVRAWGGRVRVESDVRLAECASEEADRRRASRADGRRVSTYHARAHRSTRVVRRESLGSLLALLRSSPAGGRQPISAEAAERPERATDGGRQGEGTERRGGQSTHTQRVGDLWLGVGSAAYSSGSSPFTRRPARRERRGWLRPKQRPPTGRTGRHRADTRKQARGATQRDTNARPARSKSKAGGSSSQRRPAQVDQDLDWRIGGCMQSNGKWFRSRVQLNNGGGRERWRRRCQGASFTVLGGLRGSIGLSEAGRLHVRGCSVVAGWCSQIVRRERLQFRQEWVVRRRLERRVDERHAVRAGRVAA